MKKLLIGAAAVLVLCGAAAAYLIVDHNNDVAHAKAVKAARVAKIDHQYKAALAVWSEDHDQWEKDNDSYGSCKTATDPVFDAADEVEGVISSGGSHDEFLEPTQDFSTAISRATREASGDIACLGVLLDLSKAHDKYADGLNLWLEWMQGDKYQSADSPSDLPLDKHFSKGQGYVTDAQTAMNDMVPGEEPEKPERGEKYESPADDSVDLGDLNDDGSTS